MTKKLVVLISGNGSNLQAILDACQNGELNCEVVAVVANKANAYGLERARKFNIPTIIKVPSPGQSRQEYDKELAQEILVFQPDWIILAGWMRLLSNTFLNYFTDKIINLHPALPGMFPGTRAIAEAFAAFQQGDIDHTGVMVHFVPDEGVDTGPAITQETVPIYADDTLETLTARVHEIEHRLLIITLKDL